MSHSILTGRNGFCFKRKVWTFVSITAALIEGRARADSPSQSFFPEKILPILQTECFKCHGPEKQKGGLRLDSAESLAQGGDTGAVVRPGDPNGSLLIKAVRRAGDLAMPPKTKLPDEQITLLEQWVKDGAVWPGKEGVLARVKEGLAPNDSTLRAYLQAWFHADNLPLKDGASVFHWPDSSRRNRDLHPTEGVFEGTGKPPIFAKNSAVNGHAALRFEVGSGLGSIGDKPVEITGDAAYSVILVANLKRSEHPGGSDVVVGFGEALDGKNASAGKPAAGLLQIDRTPAGQHRLDHAGGFAQDALIGRPGSFASFYDTSVIITLVKNPGPMRETSVIYINGELIDSIGGTGSTASPDIHHRPDFSIILGHAFKETGSIVGDIAEVAIYNTAFSSVQRRELEKFLGAKYGINVKPLEEGQIAELVDEKGRSHWAFQKARRPELPGLASPVAQKLVRAPIDRFLLKRLEEKGLSYSPEASKEILVRRLHLDLIGLPPTPRQRAEFLNDTAENAYENLVGKLFSSRHFGERWGRHWLDLAGYVDVNGNDQNAEQIILGESKWKYRDYVINAFNDDKPFDVFLREQLAGDELVDWRHADKFTPDIREKLIATGYLRLAIDDTHEVDLNKVPFRYQVVFDTVQLVGNSLFGMTLQCARCHDHKFDPVPQRDYYRFMSLFTPTFNPRNWLQPKDRELPDVSAAEQAEIKAANAALEEKLKPVRMELNNLLAAATNRVIETSLKGNSALNEIKMALELPAEKQSSAQKDLLKKFEKELKVSGEQIATLLSPEEKQTRESLEGRIAPLTKQRRNWDTIRAFFDSGAPPRDYVFVRGEFDHPSQRVGPGFVSVLAASARQSIIPGDPSPETTHRRLHFANFITDPNTAAAALTSRVLLNRFWQQLFGEGLVRTPDNFGINGARPTHPELLEWIVAEFVESGWKIKPVLKRIVMSGAYRQGSAFNRPDNQAGSQADPATIDPENILLWRMPLRRLESEIIRDSILQVSGKLDEQMFGPAVPLQTLPDGSIALMPDSKLATPTSKWRRSVYLMTRRNFHLPLLAGFDQPTINNSCARRMSSSVVLQPLAMLNDSFVIEQAGHVAARVRQTCPDDLNQQIKSAFVMVLAREPASDETDWSRACIQAQAGNYLAAKTPEAEACDKAFAGFCQMLLNTSEFLYVK